MKFGGGRWGAEMFREGPSQPSERLPPHARTKVRFGLQGEVGRVRSRAVTLDWC